MSMRVDGARVFDVAIVGGGVAGASLAYFLAERGVCDVVVLERESTVAYHASGRSARTSLELDPDPVVQQLKILGARFLRRPPVGFCDGELLSANGAMRLMSGEAWRDLVRGADDLRRAGLDVELLDPHAAATRVDVLDPATFDGAAYLAGGGFIDVSALLAGYLGAATRAGVELRTGVAVRAIERAGDVTTLETTGGPVRARRIVNAAGAWAGELARMAGARPLELVALRRSIATFPVPVALGADAVAAWPLVWSDPHRVYFRPGFDGLMVCAMDEAPSAPCDAVCDPGVFDAASDRLARLAPALLPRGLPAGSRQWAGLRTFTADAIPVVGDDGRAPGLFWLAGQGGCGIETSAVLARLAADLIVSGTSDVFDAATLSPRRFD